MEIQAELASIRRTLAHAITLSGMTQAELARRSGIAQDQLVALLEGTETLDLELVFGLLDTLELQPLLFFSLALETTPRQGNLLSHLFEAVHEALSDDLREDLEFRLEEEVGDASLPRTTEREMQVLIRRLVQQLKEE